MNWLKNLFAKPSVTPTLQSGALVDNRSEDEKLKDYTSEEIIASFEPVLWQEKREYRRFPIFNQDGSGSCVAQTVAKMLGVHYVLAGNPYIHFSATHVYQRRSNKPQAGMIGVNALDIATQGVTLEDLVPSQNMTDSQMDGIEIPAYKHQVGEVFKVSNYVQLPTGDIEAIASVIQKTGKPVMVWFYFENREWTTTPVILNPSLNAYALSTARHSVTAVDYALVNGKKCLIIEDSWGTSYGERGQRIITEDFFRARNLFSAYFTNFKFADGVQPSPVPDVPKVAFSEPMRFVGDPALSSAEKQEVHEAQNEAVVRLQDILKREGFFPLNVSSTGYYGSITAKAVMAWQLKYAVDNASTIQRLQGWFFGNKSIAKANELYA